MVVNSMAGLAPEDTGVPVDGVRPVSPHSEPGWKDAERNRGTGTGIGILVFSVSSGQVLFENQAACRYLNAAQDDSVRPAVAALVNQMTTRLAADGHRPVLCDMTRLNKGSGSPILLHSFGIPHRSGIHLSRVVITIRG